MITGMPRVAIAGHNFDAMVETFRDKLGMPVVDLSATTAQSLGAKLAMCVPPGGSNIELMCPADPALPLSQSLERFLARRGEGPFALMLEAADPNAEADELAGKGLAVMPLMDGAGGRDIHPKLTHGVLIRIYPTGSFQGQATREHDEPDLSGVMRVMIAVHDIERAMAVYGGKLGLRAEAAESPSDTGVRTAICRAPTGGAIELVSAIDAQRPLGKAVHAFLQDRGEGLFSLVLQSNDPHNAARVLASRGPGVTEIVKELFEIAPADTFGARIYITRRAEFC